MTENEKYYQPEMWEFHEGFEYELFEDFDHFPEKSWHKQIYGKNGANPETMDYVSYGKLKDVRVKYLDHDDIKELGWYIKREPYRWQLYKDNFMLICDIHTSTDPFPKGTIHIKDLREDQSIFYGTVKNKSELKILMKQLGI